MRTRYFGEKGAERMAEVDREVAARQEKERDYLSAEAAFLAENPSLSGEEREQKLMELRVKYFGEEEAEAYARRQLYESGAGAGSTGGQ